MNKQLIYHYKNLYPSTSIIKISRLLRWVSIPPPDEDFLLLYKYFEHLDCFMDGDRRLITYLKKYCKDYTPSKYIQNILENE